MATLEQFEEVFGKIKIINKKGEEKMDVTKTLKQVGCKPKVGKNWWWVNTTDGEIYSTFDSDVGKQIETFKGGDVAHIHYQTNEKGFKNITAIEKEVDVLEDTVADTEEDKIETGLSESLDDKTRDIHRQVAWKIAGASWGWFDLVGKDDKERMKLLSGFAKTVEEILNQ